ncbi:Peptidoglycan/xylan/chitin deacetylase, PgdA/CDA1 family [Raineyella antarctica]|uniref:Peptidoglycan/xylan/chitin deacetylase, PgdA/CDA1 family n=1 Tax=Raineyella antarctica TaxID=1577474 RepID=A0A1G6GHF3_9ACTN|nr:polysaccharide deacetylase family protein [Raineyella antarctica]SDB81452.1 Peptidoglycan/xylan/chitin deacetylase, PgdA/CDA1 family [Raineyella antarctica]
MSIERPSLSRRVVLTGGLAAAVGAVAAVAAVAGCSPRTADTTAPARTDASPTPSPTPTPTPTPATAQEIAARATVPVLCYHQVRPYAANDTSYNRQQLIIPPDAFGRHLDAIREAGYTTIDPAAYHAHLANGAKLPDKPLIMSFDDGKDNQPQNALPALTKRGMVGTWFIMSVVIGNPGWTTADQIRRAADAGHTIGCHTWDHHDVRKYTAADFTKQFDGARATLQKYSGQPVDSFAFPYGAWNEAALPHLAKAGFTTAYQLTEKPLDPKLPQLTLRRQLAVSTWSGAELVAQLEKLTA